MDIQRQITGNKQCLYYIEPPLCWVIPTFSWYRAMEDREWDMLGKMVLFEINIVQLEQ